MPAKVPMKARAVTETARDEAVRNFDDLAQTITELERLCASVLQAYHGLLLTAGSQQSSLIATAVLRDSFLTDQQLVEMNQSFNLQYLNLQQAMQDEQRRFTLLCNLMKTKHDTAKNSISNLR